MVQINEVFQAIFLEHEGNLILFPQKAASGWGRGGRKDYLFVNYAFLCSLFGLGGWGRAFFEPSGSFHEPELRDTWWL